VEKKEHLGDFNKGAAFIQTHMANKTTAKTSTSGLNSNLEIPGYNDSTLNGKGYSFNSLPNER